MQTQGAISFSGSGFDTLTTSILNEIDIVNNVIIIVDATTPPTGTSTLLILDTLGNILKLENLADSECDGKFVFNNEFFPDPLNNLKYTLQLISVADLDTDLAIGQSVDSISGCFALSTPLVLNTISYTNILDLSFINNVVSNAHLNLLGGSFFVNGQVIANPNTKIEICTIDTLNRAFNVVAALGMEQLWVLTDDDGVIIDTSTTPFTNFGQYVDQVDITSDSHHLELSHISFNDGPDYFTIGVNIKQNSCGGPTRSSSRIYELTFIECDDTCNDGLLNGTEVRVDECMMDAFSCSISLERVIACFQDSTALVSVDVTGADDEMLSFSWNTGDNTQELDSIPTGLYTVTITNSSNLQTACSIDITEPERLDVTIDLSLLTSCTATASVTGGVRPYTYLWNNDQTFISVQNLTTSPSVLVTDSNQCTDFLALDQNAFNQICGDCTDDIMNNDETGIDCGGSICEPCQTGTTDISPIQLTKLANFIDENDDGIAQVGETLEYTFTVCNTSEDTLTLVTVVDPIITVDGMAFDLEPSRCNADAFSGTYIITDSDIFAGSISNQATVSAMLQDSIMVSDLSDDPSNADNVDEGDDGEPDDPTVFALELPGPCGSPIIDTDNDGMCDILDEDDDNDGVIDELDAFPLNPSETLDTDGDGFGNNGDFDDDNDLVDDRMDAFPFDPTESVDTDEDGIGNNQDPDDDNDGIVDEDDAFPLNASESVDSDGDGMGDNEDLDDDNDGCSDDIDPNPLVGGDDCEVDPETPIVSNPCRDQETGADEIVFGGEIKTEIGFPVDSVLIRVLSSDDDSNPSFTNEDGHYVSDVLPVGASYEILPLKEDTPFPGASTLDMLFIQRHVLRIQELDTPFKIIAADVSGNQEVSIVDIIVMRQLILGVIDEWNTGLAWNFVDADFNFFDPRNPWPFDDVITDRDADGSDCNADFIAVRIGDVDNSFEARNGFTGENRSVPASRIQMVRTVNLNGDSVIDFYPTSDGLLYGFQFALDGLDGTSVIQAKSANLTDDNIHIKDKLLRISWTNPSGQYIDMNEPLFSIKTKSNKIPVINQSVLKPEIYLGHSIETHSLTLDLDSRDEELSNVRVNPNPFNRDVTIQFQQNKEQSVSFDLFSLEGKHVYTKTYRASSGNQAIHLNADQIPERGTYYYTLTSGSTRHSGSIVKVD